MARLKKAQPTLPPEPRDPVQPHVRTPEWNGLKTGDPVLVNAPGVKPKRGVHYKFSNHVVSPEGHEYIDVVEYKVGFTSGLWRSFPLDAVTPAPVRKRAVKATHLT